MASLLPNLYLIIPAGGSGLRFGGETPKQFLPFRTSTLLQETIKSFVHDSTLSFVKVFICVPEDRVEHTRNWELPNNFFIIKGGMTRFESVLNGLSQIPDDPDPLVLIHDGVRPYPPMALITSTICSVQSNEVVILAEIIPDTVKRITPSGAVVRTESRVELVRAQTPQFAYKSIWTKSFDFAIKQKVAVTDDAMAAEAAGIPVRVVISPSTNKKITFVDDLNRP